MSASRSGLIYLMEQHEEWMTGRRYLKMEEYYAWKASREGFDDSEESADSVA